ncbi:hypothetical protein ACWEN3_33830 [Streptomyces sp. NPDC004561]
MNHTVEASADYRPGEESNRYSMQAYGAIFAEVRVDADIGELEAIFVDDDDPHVNPLGTKGVGEIASIGVAPAIANAVYHATGRRMRSLPITPAAAPVIRRSGC